MWQGRWAGIGNNFPYGENICVLTTWHAETNVSLKVRTPKPLTLNSTLPTWYHVVIHTQAHTKNSNPPVCSICYLSTAAMKSTPADPSPKTRGGVSIVPWARPSDMAVAAMEQRRRL